MRIKAHIIRNIVMNKLYECFVVVKVSVMTCGLIFSLTVYNIIINTSKHVLLTLLLYLKGCNSSYRQLSHTHNRTVDQKFSSRKTFNTSR